MTELAVTHQLYALAEDAELPRIWKSLGVVGAATLARYSIPSLYADLDVDREAELRQMLAGALLSMYRARVDPAEQPGFALRYAGRDLCIVYERIGEPFWCSVN